ncbi:MAG: HAD family hydrolase [Candidatus Aenigmarchaeota archaeon]|nr:HAD family hydrolase [Candidatus Aenigmarchaeota archaeon]
MIKVVVFDFDGVLVDSNEAWADIFNKAASSAGVKKNFTYDDIKPHYGKPYVEVFKSAHPRFRQDSGVMEAMYSNFIRLATQDDFSNSFRTIGGMKSMLGELRKRYKLAVGSGNSRRLLDKFLKKLGLMRYFDMVVGGDDVKKGKPNPDMLVKIIRHFGIQPHEGVYVGDSEADILCAKSASMKSVAVLTGALDREQAEGLGPDCILEDATKLREAIECMS